MNSFDISLTVTFLHFRSLVQLPCGGTCFWHCGLDFMPSLQHRPTRQGMKTEGLTFQPVKPEPCDNVSLERSQNGML